MDLIILIESGVLLKARTRTPERKSRLLYRSHQGILMERSRELYQERQWELYRLSVVERMPDSEYKTAVLAAIAHKLMRLDSIEANSRGPFSTLLIAKPGRHSGNGFC